MKRMTGTLLVLWGLLAGATQMPEDFVSLADKDPTIGVEIRYATSHNFVGRPIRGYHANRCFLTTKAAEALGNVQKEVTTFGFTLKVYDCYRPRRAVEDFIEWSKKSTDIKMKEEFYPHLEKSDLFHGYLSAKSKHSSGSTVDLTLVPLPIPVQAPFVDGDRLLPCTEPVRFADNSLDMGTGYDCLDPKSRTQNPSLSPEVRAHRLLLRTVMEKHGFTNYPNEWWHFTLVNEPYPDRAFDFEVK
jgi:zinc D-Ala-D-Ala dipeptidase